MCYLSKKLQICFSIADLLVIYLFFPFNSLFSLSLPSPLSSTKTTPTPPSHHHLPKRQCTSLLQALLYLSFLHLFLTKQRHSFLHYHPMLRLHSPLPWLQTLNWYCLLLFSPRIQLQFEFVGFFWGFCVCVCVCVWLWRAIFKVILMN